MPIDYQNALLNLMRQAEARRKQTEYEAPLVPSTALQVGNLLARVGGDIMARRDRQAAENKINLANQTNETVKARQTAFENAMNMYRSGVQVPPELAKQAGVEGLARLTPPVKAPQEKKYAKQLKILGDEWVVFDPLTGVPEPTGQKVTVKERTALPSLKEFKDRRGNSTFYIWDPNLGSFTEANPLQGKKHQAPGSPEPGSDPDNPIP